jgi:hypothetical protein
LCCKAFSFEVKFLTIKFLRSPNGSGVISQEIFARRTSFFMATCSSWSAFLCPQKNSPKSSGPRESQDVDVPSAMPLESLQVPPQNTVVRRQGRMEFCFCSAIGYYWELMAEKTHPGSYTTICAASEDCGKKPIFINLGLL